MVRRGVAITLFISGLLGLLLWTASCAIDPVSGSPGLMLLSEEKEIQLGRQTDAQVVRQYGLYEDAALTAYIDDLGHRMARLSHRSHLDYRFKILDASVINAFAVPGGYVYFTRGILANLNSEAELAGVMGHEIGHITARHSAEQYSRAMLAQLGLAAGMIFSEALRGLADFAQLGVSMLFLKFSRDNEREADDLGVEYASKAGYEAGEMANFFETLEKMNPGSDRTGLPSWFSTHPSPEDRVGVVRARSREWQRRLGLKDPNVGRETYLRRIDGIVFGEDPRQGYVEKGVFYHPDLKFQFPVPADWTVKNTPSQVQVVSTKKDAAILFSLTSGPSAKEAGKAFAEKSGARVISAGAIKVNGLSSYRLVLDISTQSGFLRAISYFIEKGKHIYVFHGICSPSLFQRYEASFVGTMGQFRHLSDPKRIHVQPDRIRVRPAKRAGSVKSALISLGVREKKLKEIALLNGKSLDESIPANSLLKLVEKGR